MEDAHLVMLNHSFEKSASARKAAGEAKHESPRAKKDDVPAVVVTNSLEVQKESSDGTSHERKEARRGSVGEAKPDTNTEHGDSHHKKKEKKHKEHSGDDKEEGHHKKKHSEAPRKDSDAKRDHSDDKKKEIDAPRKDSDTKKEHSDDKKDGAHRRDSLEHLDEPKKKEKRSSKRSHERRKSADVAHNSQSSLAPHSITHQQNEQKDQKAAQKPNQEEVFSFFGVYDGHSGKLASDFTSQRLYQTFESLSEVEANLDDALKKAFLKTEQEFIDMAKKDGLPDGTTAVVAVIDANHRIVVGNVGDSEALICRKGKPFALSVPHNPAKNESELQRVQDSGGKIYNYRIAHPCLNPKFFNIAVSRSIGDLMFKDEEYTQKKISGLIADPSFESTLLTPDDQFLVLACDGLFDVLTHEQVVEFVLNLRATQPNITPEEICKELVDDALSKGSSDNITALLVFFEWQ